MKKNVALLHFSAPPVVGGVESVIGHHARLMADDGHNVTIIAGRGTAVDPRVQFIHIPQADSRYETVIECKAALDEGIVPGLFEDLILNIQGRLENSFKKNSIDIVFAHNVCSLHKNLALTAALRRACAQSQAPRLICWHHDLAWTTPQYRSEVHEGWPWNLIGQDWPEIRPQQVVISELRQRELADLFHISIDRIQVIPSGLEIDRFLKLSPQTCRFIGTLDLFRSAPLLLLPVRITRRKNIELAIQAVAHIKMTFPDVQLIVTGPPGPHNPSNQAYFDQLKTLRRRLNLQNNVRFLTELSDTFLPDAVISDFYQLADALVLPSREEGFGIPILEAGLTGLPLFCTDIPPLRAIAGPHASYFSPDIKPEQLAVQLVLFFKQDKLFQMRRKVRRDYVWERIYNKKIAPLLAFQ